MVKKVKDENRWGLVIKRKISYVFIEHVGRVYRLLVGKGLDR